MIATPIRSVYQKMIEQEHQGHSKRLKAIKPFIKIEQPPEFGHLRRRNHDIFRLSQIESQNAKIMSRIQELTKSRSDVSLPGFRHSSLNKEYRLKEQERIDRENLLLLKRLAGTSSTYPFKEFMNQRRDNERYIKTRCVYPYTPALNVTSAELVHTEKRVLNSVSYSFKVFRRSTYVIIKAIKGDWKFKILLTNAEAALLGDDLSKVLDFVVAEEDDLVMVFPKGAYSRKFARSKSS